MIIVIIANGCFSAPLISSNSISCRTVNRKARPSGQQGLAAGISAGGARRYLLDRALRELRQRGAVLGLLDWAAHPLFGEDLDHEVLHLQVAVRANPVDWNARAKLRRTCAQAELSAVCIGCGREAASAAVKPTSPMT